jgi:competence protein ComGC
MNSRKRAFTLAETCLVVCLVAILSSTAIPNLFGARDRAKSNSCIINLTQIDAAKEMLKVDKGLHDADVPLRSQLVPKYMRAFPECPAGGTYSINSIQNLPTCSVRGHQID